MHQSIRPIRQHLIVTYAISLGLMTASMSLLQPIPSASAQQLIGPVSQETSGTGTQGGASRTCYHPSIPNEILGEEGRANLDPQAPSTNSKTTERSRRDPSNLLHPALHLSAPCQRPHRRYKATTRLLSPRSRHRSIEVSGQPCLLQP